MMMTIFSIIRRVTPNIGNDFGGRRKGKGDAIVVIYWCQESWWPRPYSNNHCVGGYSIDKFYSIQSPLLMWHSGIGSPTITLMCWYSVPTLFVLSVFDDHSLFIRLLNVLVFGSDIDDVGDGIDLLWYLLVSIGDEKRWDVTMTIYSNSVGWYWYYLFIHWLKYFLTIDHWHCVDTMMIFDWAMSVISYSIHSDR